MSIPAPAQCSEPSRHADKGNPLHVHISPVEFLVTAAFIVIFGFLWRSLSAKWADKPVGKAMAFIY